MSKTIKQRSIRILFDLQATQTPESQSRGVGRYSRDFFNAVASAANAREVYALFNSNFATDQFPNLPENRKIFLPAMPDWQTTRDFHGGESDSLDSLALSAFVGQAKADIIHVSHIFEGLNTRVPLPNYKCKPKGQLFSATLYDLIPLRFQDHYFENLAFKKWYLSRLNYLSQMDLLFAISESSRQDAINLLNIDPKRIVTIPGGISAIFKPVTDRNNERIRLQKKFTINDKFILYTGGDDYRKNIRGAIHAFSLLPQQVKNNCQLFIACAIEDSRKAYYSSFAKEVGLNSNDIIISGFVSEQDLVGLYSTCDLFVFPSLYEGFGLPILEAMSCGAPVIGGDNSSIKELISISNALFDSNCVQSIAQKMTEVLTDSNFEQHLREYSLARAPQVTWAKSAEVALSAWDEALSINQQSAIQATIHGWLPKKRIAMFTPLPPCKSGIADYNANFLPYLSKYFDIDLYVDNYPVDNPTLTSLFRIYNVGDFEKVAGAYDLIFYEMGNSEFHYHMLPLCEKYPGVIGLHDAYLSGLMGYVEFNLGEENHYAKEMLYSHDTLARNYLAPLKNNTSSIGEAMVNLPCTKRVLDLAIGIISHATFNLETSRHFYPAGHGAPYRIIPQMVKLVEPTTAHERKAIRTSFNFSNDDFVICSFGHITWNKCGDLLLQAYLESILKKENAKVIFVGELSKDEYGKNIQEFIKKHNLENRIKITGFLDEQDYHKYLMIADVAIQLRIHSRGGTPKGVLDCLNYGIPVIVNDDASYKDYPNNVVHKIAAIPTTQDIKKALEHLYIDKARCKELATNGRQYLESVHNPESSAAQYAVAIHEFCDRDHYAKASSYMPLMAPHLAQTHHFEDAIENAIAWLNQNHSIKFTLPRLFIDVSHIARFDHETGIQRVVKEIVKAAYCFDSPCFEPIAFILDAGKLKPATNWLMKTGLIFDHESQSLPEENLEFRPGDILLMLDSSWGNFADFKPIFEQAAAARVPIYTAIYDILPLTLPSGNFVEGGKEWFQSWLQEAAKASDAFICISKATAEDVNHWLSERNDLVHKPKIGYWHLGCNFATPEALSKPTTQTQKVLEHPYLLMVGTIEPRKGHALAIASMEKLWQQNSDLCLCIAGKEGWLVTETMEHIKNHPLLNKKLFFIEKPQDEEIAQLYQNATALLFLSKGEGFGLPIIEAANYDIPIICSNISVLKEIAGSFATYVEIENSETLANDLEKWYTAFQQGDVLTTANLPRFTWKESVGALYNVLLNNNWYRSDNDSL